MRTKPYPPSIDERLLERLRRRDMRAFDELYGLYARPVYSIGYRLCRCRDAAEDVVQETFLEAFHSIAGYRGGGPFWAWLKRVAASKALMRLRSERRLVLSDDASEEPGAGAEFDQASPDEGDRYALCADLEWALGCLTDTARVVVWLYDVEGYTHAEIAALMGKTQSFSKSQLARARKRLRELLESREQAVRRACESPTASVER